MRRLGIGLDSLPAQMILSFVALVILTAVAAGLPAVWLIRNQLDRQAWAQLERGVRAAHTLYMARQSEVESLATLTAQRPTLRALLTQGDQAALPAYLDTLRAGAGLTLVLICAPDHRTIAQAGQGILEDLCALNPPTGFHVVEGRPAPQVWLLAAHPISGEAAGLGDVIVGLILNDEFAAQMRAQTGLEHTVLVAGQPVATSFAGGVTRWATAYRRSTLSTTPDDTARGTFSLDGHPYYSIRFPLSSPSQGEVGRGLSLEDEMALSVANMVTTQWRLVWTLAGGILVVAALGSALGVFLARRIGRPLDHLAGAAARFSQGDLGSPVAVEARVREVALVAQALEGARSDLQRTLHHLRAEKAWTDHLLEAIVEGIVTLDQDGRITFFSRGAERITGWSRDQVTYRPCNEVFRAAERDQPFTELIPPPGQQRKITVELADGRQATLAVTGAQLAPPEGGEARLALVFRDVSEEDAVHRLLGHFLANVSHEIRTPLSALAASIELLLDQAPDLSTAELQELLTSLHLGILSLQTLVDNLLESASIEAGRFRVHPRPSDLGEILAEATRTMQPLLDKRGQHLLVELPADIPVVQADPRRAAQVLVNLLSNASRYGPDHAEIAIRVILSDGWVQVTVADQGPGIPPEYKDAVFRRFMHPGPENARAQYGAGLGLSVVKAIVEAHGGQVGVKDRPGGGSVFWFTLPVASGW